MKLLSTKCRIVFSVMICALMIFNLFNVSYAVTENTGVKMFWASDFSQTEWEEVGSESKIFDVSAFEPGDEVVRYLDIRNTGDLALAYTLDFVIGEGADVSLAEVIDVYVGEDVTDNVAPASMTNVGTLKEVLANKTLSVGKISPDGEEKADGFAEKARKIAIALKMNENAGEEYFGKELKGFKLQLTATETDYNYKKVEKFTLKFPNTDKYLYRVGNENTVSLSSLFACDNVIGKANVTIENISGDANGTYAANISDWKKGAIQFTGTGSVKVTVCDEGRKTAPTSLYLEVIKATNATTATSAKSNDVVLLNDVGFSTLDVSGGHTLYGNGFTMSCTNDVYTQYMSYSFVKLENGTLDNVRVIVPNFSYAILYDSNKKDSANPYYQPTGTTEVSDRYYYNMRSAVVMEGTSRIVNSYISGGRAAVYARSGYHTIDNSTIYGGATANIHIVSAQNMTLKDTTLIQEPIQATVHDTSKTLMGFSVVAECDSTGLGAPITLEGDFLQYAWVHQGYSSYVPSAGSSFMTAALKRTDYMHSITYPDGTTASSLNLGIFYLPDGENNPIQPSNLTDNRTNKDTVPYGITSVSALTKSAYIYSYSNSNGTVDEYKTKPAYITKGQGNIQADLSYDDSAEADSFTTSFDSQKGKVYNLTVDLDEVDSYAFSFSNLKALKGGKELNYTVKDSSGNTVDKSATITLTDMQATEYTLTITDNASYNVNGEEVSDKVVTYDCNFKLVST